MSFIESYLGAAVVFMMGILAVVFANAGAIAPITAVATTTPSTSSSPEIVPITLPQISMPDLAVATATQATTSVASLPPKAFSPIAPKKAAPKPIVPINAPVAVKSEPVAEPAPVTISSGSVSLDASSSLIRKALVNIICYAPAGGKLHSISGSGVIIDPKGIILTNAHIGQYFLLADRGVDCTVRAGSPAADAYKASLVYISPLWIRANTTVLSQTEPTGTGEYDFALLAITGSETSLALPASFPSIPLAQSAPQAGTPVVIASYGAQFLSANEIQSSLYPTIVFGTIKDIFTFTTTTTDVFSLGGSAAAQEGSSGGGVADSSGQLVGTITTSTVEGSTDNRNLSAITASYIRGEYATEMGSPIDLLFSEPISQAVSEFMTQIPTLEPIITAQLN